MNLKRQISHIYFNKIKIPTLPTSGLVRTSKEIRFTEPQDELEEIMPGVYDRHPRDPGAPVTLEFLQASKSGLPFSAEKAQQPLQALARVR